MCLPLLPNCSSSAQIVVVQWYGYSIVIKLEGVLLIAARQLSELSRRNGWFLCYHRSAQLRKHDGNRQPRLESPTNVILSQSNRTDYDLNP
jgi:hypothetical protein